ncbi:unnamed protein product, partial [Dibothriocephalus latus]
MALSVAVTVRELTQDQGANVPPDDEGENSGVCVVTLPPTKWHWRARTGALALAALIPKHAGRGFRVMFTSSVFSLPELL